MSYEREPRLPLEATGSGAAPATIERTAVRVPAGTALLEGDLAIPWGARGLVAFAHGSGSSRHSVRNRLVADEINDAGLGTLLFDLLTAEEERVDVLTREHRFDIALLSQRLVGAVDWLIGHDATGRLAIGLFGASTGAAAALVAAARRPDAVSAVVSRGGRPDLAGEWLHRVRAPTLLVVGGLDHPVIEMNEGALARLTAARARALEIVPGATHLFEEPGTLEVVAALAADWFGRWLG